MAGLENSLRPRGSRVLIPPLGGLVTLLQGAAGRAATDTGTIPPERAGCFRAQLRFCGSAGTFRQPKRDHLSTAFRPDSEVIKRFGLLNEEVSPEDDGYGIPHPGTFVGDRDGIVRSKYFEKDYRERQSFYSVASQEFGAVSGTRKSSISTPQLKISTSASQDTVVAANRLTLAVEINLPSKMHVYAPEAEDYRPLELQIEPSAAFRVHPTVFPQAEVLYLAAIDERVPVYETEVRLLTDITLAGSRELKKYVTSGDPVAVEGILRFQACDDRVCFPPQEVPLRWVLNVVAFDGERVPGEFRHKSKNQE